MKLAQASIKIYEVSHMVEKKPLPAEHQPWKNNKKHYCASCTLAHEGVRVTPGN